MIKVLISGANGFIGKNLVSFFIENTDYELILTDKFFNNLSIYTNRRIKLIEHNIEKVFKDNIVFNADIVIHLAAIVGEAACLQDIERAYKVNTIGTLNLVRTLDVQKLKSFILLSSSNVYSLNNNMPVKEDGDINTESIYSTTKLAAESIIYNFFHNTLVSYYMCRVSNVYGPGHNVSTIMNYIIKQFTDKRDIEIFGPEDKRDFIYIDDLIKCINLFLEKQIESGKYNIGGNESLKIIDIVNLCSQILNKNIKVTTKYKPGNILFLDTRKINKYGWEHKVNIKEGLTFCLNKK